MLNSRNLTGKMVVVTAGGMTYEGKLIEMNENALILKSVQGFTEVPLDRVTEMLEKGEVKHSILAPSPLREFFAAKANETKE